MDKREAKIQAHNIVFQLIENEFAKSRYGIIPGMIFTAVCAGSPRKYPKGCTATQLDRIEKAEDVDSQRVLTALEDIQFFHFNKSAGEREHIKRKPDTLSHSESLKNW